MTPDRPRAEQTLPALQQLEGATLQWRGLGPTHRHFRLLATGLPRGTAEVACSMTQFLDLPRVMHHVHFRIATEEETEALRPLIAPAGARSLRRENHLIIQCDEGQFSIWAELVLVHWLDEPSGFLDSFDPGQWPSRLLLLLEGNEH